MLDLSFLEPGARADPYPSYRRLRETSPVHVIESGGRRSVVLSRHGDITAALRSDALGHGHAGKREGHAPPGAAAGWAMRNYMELSAAFADLIERWMLLVDPPYHDFLRGQVGRAFAPAVIEGQRPSVLAIVDELLDGAIAAGSTMDIRADFSYPLAIYVIADLLGVPRRDYPRLKQWARHLAGALDPPGRLGTPFQLVAFRIGVGRSVSELQAYFAELAEAKRKRPGDDLLSTLVTRDDAGDRLSEDELVATCIQLIVAGHVTTVDLVANGMLALLRAPEQTRALRSDPGLAATAVEELLRYDTPVQLTSRMALEACEVAGVELAPGDDVTMLLGAANRDPAVFERPDDLDLGRHPNPHLAFSAGIHYCIGSALARVEAQVAIPRLLQRMPGLHLASEPERAPGLALRGLVSLPVSY